MDPISATSSRNPSISFEPSAPPPPPATTPNAAPQAPREPSLSVSYGQNAGTARMQSLMCPPAGQRVQPPAMEGEQIRNRLGIAPLQANHTQSQAMQQTLNERLPEGLRSLGFDAARTGMEVAEIAGAHVGEATPMVMFAASTALLGRELAQEINHNLTGHSTPTPSAIAAVREEENANAAFAQRAADGALAVQYRNGADNGLNGAQPARPTDRAYMMGFEAGQSRRSECGAARIDAERAARPSLRGPRDVGSL